MQPTKRFKMDRYGKTLIARQNGQCIPRGAFGDVRGLLISAQLEEEASRNAKAKREEVKKEEPVAA